MTTHVPAPTLQAGGLRLRPATAADQAALATLLAEPEVARWWVHGRLDEAVAELLEVDDDTTVLAIEVDGTVAGLIQFSEELEPDYRHAGVDLFVGTAWQGRGIGPAAIRLVARHLFDERGHHRITIDPAAANERAIRAYEKVGFRRVGIMREYERGADGTWHDGLLMDLLRGELRAAD
ncbi:MAG: GNAT family protein [Chloroflexota bacterium]